MPQTPISELSGQTFLLLGKKNRLQWKVAICLIMKLAAGHVITQTNYNRTSIYLLYITIHCCHGRCIWGLVVLPSITHGFIFLPLPKLSLVAHTLCISITHVHRKPLEHVLLSFVVHI